MVLNNLRFKKSALQDIELPVTVNEGMYCGLALLFIEAEGADRLLIF